MPNEKQPSKAEGEDQPVVEQAAEKAAEVVEGAGAAAAGAKQDLTEAAVEIAGPEPPEKRAALREMGGVRALDASIFLAVNHLPHSQTTNDLVETVSDLGKGAGWVAAATVLAVAGSKGGWRTAAVTTATMLAATGLTQGPIKAYFLRQRPWAVLEEDIVIGKRTTDSSFPSGHTAGSFAAGLAMSHCYPRHRPMLLGIAAAVGFSRIYLGHHYPSDVLGGVIIGAVVGLGSGKISDALVRNNC
ncbi:MAG TPA: phosphatase PAP2 family protein [Candidatus Dormibacteraeota bacterium]|nr:phosphatase PAP2 family protein [Candidatus Dormibacteraeota bacterium]